MPEAAVSGDANMGPANVHAGPGSAEVTATKVTAGEVAPAKVTAASVSATSMTASASTTGKGRCRNCRTAQKDSGNGYEQCFSQHHNLHHGVSKLCRRVFPSSTRSSGQCSSATSYGLYNEEIWAWRFKRN
jgi:hypothetical protein